MVKYYVESGSMKLRIFAESALEAALEAVAWWGERSEIAAQPGVECLGEEVRVRRNLASGEAKRYATVRLIAQNRRQSLTQVLADYLCAA
jgi:hypothetical protein